ncbi:hypothetical protein ACLKA6_011166 [Drosophila palustris]
MQHADAATSSLSTEPVHFVIVTGMQHGRFSRGVSETESEAEAEVAGVGYCVFGLWVLGRVPCATLGECLAHVRGRSRGRGLDSRALSFPTPLQPRPSLLKRTTSLSPSPSPQTTIMWHNDIDTELGRGRSPLLATIFG